MVIVAEILEIVLAILTVFAIWTIASVLIAILCLVYNMVEWYIKNTKGGGELEAMTGNEPMDNSPMVIKYQRIAPDEQHFMFLRRNHCTVCDGTALEGPATDSTPCPGCGQPSTIVWVQNRLFAGPEGGAQ